MKYLFLTVLFFSSNAFSAQPICENFSIDQDSISNMKQKFSTAQEQDHMQAGMDHFVKMVDRFRKQKLQNSYICKNKISIKAYEHAENMTVVVWNTLKVNRKLLVRIGSLLNKLDDASLNEYKLYKEASLGVITYFAFVGDDYLSWYRSEAMAAVWDLDSLGAFNRDAAFKMSKENPKMALGLGFYRVLTFEDVEDHKKDRKQKTHATPYQIANYLNNNGNAILAKELLTLAKEKGYYLVDKSTSPEITLSDLEGISLQ